MFQTIEFQNFRSLRDFALPLRANGLNIIVGPNGAGKSNVMRGFALIKELHSEGLEAALVSNGGRDSIIPKGYEGRLWRAKTRIKYSARLPPPRQVSSDEWIRADHELEVTWLSRGEFKVSEERVRFHHALSVSKALRLRGDSETIALEDSQPSWVEFHRKSTYKRLKVRTYPKFSKDNAEDFVGWFGLPIGKNVTTKTGFDELVRKFIPESFEDRGSRQSLFNPEQRGLLTIAPQGSALNQVLRRITNYDFSLSELRRPQVKSSSQVLASDGSNLPNLVSGMAADASERAAFAPNWERVVLTLSEINPHVEAVDVGDLKSFEQFVEFMETNVGRPVESWNQSDGTLRALAILVAIETQKVGGTVVIEEPEKGLHPWAVRTLMDFIREVSEQRKLQVILTTHSAQVLEAAEPNELFVLQRKSGAGTEVDSVKDIVDTSAIRGGDLGRLWVKGLLGGVPE